MSCTFSWYRRNEEGRREQIEFHLIREKATWRIHRVRNEPREPYDPDDTDWETLLEVMERNLKRGKVYPPDLKRVRDLRERASR